MSNEFANFESDALRKFDSLTNVSDSSSEMQDLYSRCLLIPDLCIQIQKAVEASSQFTSKIKLLLPKSSQELIDTAISQSSIALGVSGDSLLTLFNVIIKTKNLPRYSTWILLRNVSESALYARWLSNSNDLRTLIDKGYTAKFHSLEEQIRFLNNTKHANQEVTDTFNAQDFKVRQIFQTHISLGKELGLLSSNREAPILERPSSTSLFQNVHGPVGMQDVRYLFNVMSGVVHGLDWATQFVSKTETIKTWEEATVTGMKKLAAVKSVGNPGGLVLILNISLLQVMDATNNLFKIAEKATA